MSAWDLIFHIEDTEAQERVRFIEASLRNDIYVRLVEEYGIGQTNCRHIKVWFVEGYDKPFNKTLQHLHQIHGEAIDRAGQVSSLDVLLGDEWDQL